MYFSYGFEVMDKVTEAEILKSQFTFRAEINFPAWLPAGENFLLFSH